LNNFFRDPIPSLGQRLSEALPDILEHKIEPDDLVSSIWPNGPDLTDPVKLDLLVIPEEGVCAFNGYNFQDSKVLTLRPQLSPVCCFGTSLLVRY